MSDNQPAPAGDAYVRVTPADRYVWPDPIHIPCDHYCWESIADALVKSGIRWPDAAIQMDLRWWSVVGRRPGRDRLIARWNVGPSVARRLLREADGPPVPRIRRHAVGEIEPLDWFEIDLPDASHDALSYAGWHWLRRKGCTVACVEPVTRAPITPDAIGWTPCGETMLIEAKTSRSNFIADRQKPAHQSERVPGVRRWYLCPEGVLTPSDMPDGWGLLVVRGSYVIEVHASPVRAELVTESECGTWIMAAVMARLAAGGRICDATGRLLTGREVGP